MTTLTQTTTQPQLSTAQKFAQDLRRLEIEAWNDVLSSIAKDEYGLTTKPETFAFRSAYVYGLEGEKLGQIGVDVCGVIYYFCKSRPSAFEAMSLHQALGQMLKMEAPRCHL